MSLTTDPSSPRWLGQPNVAVVPADVRPPDFDGVAELWFDDIGALLHARGSEEWRLSSLDERNFIDPVSTAYLVSEERMVFEAPAA